MRRKIFKTGHSLAVTVTKKILEELGLKLGDTVSVEIFGDKAGIIIKPAKSGSQQPLALHLRHKLGERR